jgi:hypothetical protein
VYLTIHPGEKRSVKRTIALVLVIFVLSGLAPVRPAAAQDDLRLSSLWVRLWPEYDQPSLLVIYVGELAETTTYPATVNLRMPARVTAPFVVAAQASPDALIDETPYEVVEDGLWRTVAFQANGPNFQFEYYDDLNREGDVRQPSFTWPGDYAVDSLIIELQQPPHASELTIDPALAASQVSSEDGLTYHIGQFGPLEAGSLLGFQIRYVRSEEMLTAELLSTLGTASGASSSSSTASNRSGSSGGIDLVLLVLVAVVSFLLGAASMRIAINIQMNRRSR